VSRLLTFATGRVTRWVILALVLPLFAIAGAASSNLEKATENESSSFLPGDSESAKALEEIKRFPGGETAAAITVYQRAGGLTARDRALIVQARRRFNADPPRGVLRAPPPTFSRDGTTALLIAEVKSTGGNSDRFLDTLDAFEKRTEIDAAPGLEQKLTGPGGFARDAIKVFGNIDGVLILAAGALVFVLLILIYRSPVFWIWPFFTVLLALVIARTVAWLFAEAGLTVNGQSSGILAVLVFGAGTDYALLLAARYREELRRHESQVDAARIATRRAGVPIIASGLTVIASLLCLTLAKVDGTAGLGPVGAIGVAVAMITSLTVLPALLATVGGRWSFWPRIPHFGDTGTDETHGAWRRIGERVAAHPRRTWIGTTALLLVLACGLFTFNTNLTRGNSFRGEVESVEGQELVDRAFPAGANAPTDVIVPDRERVAAVVTVLSHTSGVDSVRTAGVGRPGTRLAVTLDQDPYSVAAFDRVPELRRLAKQAGGDEVLVGGPTATEHDLREAAMDDTLLIVPISLAVVFLILILVLRAVVAPALLIATVIVSFAAALGIGSFFTTEVFGFPGLDASFPLFVFVFLVALGIDYNIFLMARVREESLAHGTRRGMLRGLAVTGAVITSAGIVLAGTFGVLAVLPLIFLTTLGFTIAVGVLLDTFVVRSVLVPALTFDIGPKVWWPSALARKPDPPSDPDDDPSPDDQAASSLSTPTSRTAARSSASGAPFST
jgi:putative drug exporter of the RND superfamily